MVSCQDCTLWLSNQSIKSLFCIVWPIEIDGLPNLKMVIFHSYVSHNQMVNNHFGHPFWLMKSSVKPWSNPHLMVSFGELPTKIA